MVNDNRDSAAASGTDTVTEDVGGVQGTSPEDAATNNDVQVPHLASPAPQQPAPDAGEIEWADLAKRPPAPAN